MRQQREEGELRKGTSKLCTCCLRLVLTKNDPLARSFSQFMQLGFCAGQKDTTNKDELSQLQLESKFNFTTYFWIQLLQNVTATTPRN